MSLKTWKARYYPVRAVDVLAGEESIIHSLNKWKGLRDENLMAHGLHVRLIVGGAVAGIVDSDGDGLRINFSSCALCGNYLKYGRDSACEDCPIYKYRGHSCDTNEWGSSVDSAFYIWEDTGNPEPMIRLLEKTLEHYRETHG